MKKAKRVTKKVLYRRVVFFQSGFFSPVIILIVLVVGFGTFYLGTSYGTRTPPQGVPEAEAARGGKSIFDSYADCSTYKQSSTDVIPPTISITKPEDGSVVSGVSGSDILWVSVKPADDQGYVYPSLYVNDALKLTSLSFNISPDDPSTRTAYIHIKPGKTYTLKAKACDNGGNETWSSPIKFTTST